MFNNVLVYIIILTYNGKKWIDNCLNSVFKTNYPNYRALVIDNASTDGTAEYIESNFPQVELIKNKKNYGFAKGNNIGIKYALSHGADYVVLLNQDTKVDPSWISELVKFMEGSKELGIASPMQYDYEGQNIDRNFLNNILKKYTTYEKDKYSGNIREVYYVNEIIGASFIISRKIIEKIGLFDPLYFLYKEEYDLCRRAQYHNFRVVVVTNSKIYHWHSLIQPNTLTIFNNYHMRRSQLVYQLKDPEKTLIRCLMSYFKLLMKHILKIKPLIKNFRIHLWIFCHLPLLAWSRIRENKRVLYKKQHP